MEIKPISMSDQLRMVKGVEGIKEQDSSSTGQSRAFTEFLKESLAETNRLGLEADQGIQDVISGKDVESHSVLIALQKADVSFKLLMSVKERLVQAYQQVIRTPIG